MQLINRLVLQLIWQIVRMQLSHGEDSRLARVSYCFAGTGLHHSAAFLCVLCPDTPSGIPSIFLHEPTSSDPEPYYQAEDNQQDDDGYGDCDGQCLRGNSAAAAAAVATVVTRTSSCYFIVGVRGRGAGS
jgi:hypothetical protein